MTHEELIALGVEHEEKCDWPSAIAAYRQLCAQSSTIFLISKLAWCYSRNNNFKEAKEQCAILVDKEPDNAKWWYMYGYQFYMEKNWAEAIKHYEKSLEYNSEYFVVLYRISYAYLQIAGEFLKLTKSEYWKAIGYLKKAHLVWEQLSEERKTIEKTTYYHVNFLHGKALMLIPNHNDNAIKFFKQAIALKDDIDCRYNLAKALCFNDEYEQAKAMLPLGNKYYIVELKATIEFKLGNTDEALSIVQNLLKQRPKDYLYCFAANIELERNNIDNAYQYAQKAISVNNRNHKNFYILALIYFKYGLLKKSLDTLELAEQIKVKRYNSEYQDCENLRSQIMSIMGKDYTDDMELNAKLEGASSFHTATINQYNDNRGFGFADFDGQKIFVHISNVKNGKPYVGAKIKFKIESTNKGKQAKDATIL